MFTCPSCDRHLLPGTTACPFCAATGTVGRVAAAAALVVTPFVLAACYGGPPKDYDGDNCDTSTDTACDDVGGEANAAG